MSRFERILLGVVLVLLMGIGATQYWRTTRPVFVSAQLNEEDLRLMPLGQTGQYKKYLIGHRPLAGTEWECEIDCYQQGELVKTMPFGGGTAFSPPRERGMQTIYLGLTTTMDMEREHAILLGVKGITSWMAVDIAESLPVDLYVPRSVRLTLDEPLVMGVVVQSSEYIERDQVFDPDGGFNEEILQRESVYVIRCQISLLEKPQ